MRCEFRPLCIVCILVVQESLHNKNCFAINYSRHIFLQFSSPMQSFSKISNLRVINEPQITFLHCSQTECKKSRFDVLFGALQTRYPKVYKFMSQIDHNLWCFYRAESMGIKIGSMLASSRQEGFHGLRHGKRGIKWARGTGSVIQIIKAVCEFSNSQISKSVESGKKLLCPGTEHAHYTKYAARQLKIATHQAAYIQVVVCASC